MPLPFHTKKKIARSASTDYVSVFLQMLEILTLCKALPTSLTAQYNLRGSTIAMKEV